ncbi:MAG: FtsW/RodA/SpoVE family cell cycle protein, partial [Verrucomicrobiota bacterium]
MKAVTSTLIFCVAALLSLGMVTLYSSSTAQVGSHYLIMQLIWCGLGLVGATVLAMLDYHHFKTICLPLLALSLILLVLVYVPGIGIKVNGAKRWIGHGGLRFQSSELAKMALIVFVAFYGERFQRHMSSFWKGLVAPGCVIAVVLALIYREPDRGCTLLLIGVCATMLIVAGANLKIILPSMMVGLTAFAFALWRDPLRAKRILAWLNPELTKEGTGYQAYQARRKPRWRLRHCPF